MVTKSILIIDDEQLQARALKETIVGLFTDANVFYASEQADIVNFVENKFYNLVLLDLRMDGYDFDGVELASKIMAVNPFAKILFISKFTAEYMSKLAPLLAKGEVLGFSEKRDYELWKDELKSYIGDYYNSLDEEPSRINSALLSYYADIKNEEDAFKKGEKFENFVTVLFRSIGYKEILKRVKDRSLNETDLIIRNDIDDKFLEKFGKYFLVECKNKPNENTNKNDYIIFRSKLESTTCMSELGLLFTTSTVTKNTYIEAVRDSKENKKIIIIDNIVMHQLLNSDDLKEGFKKIIDSQVKDN